MRVVLVFFSFLLFFLTFEFEKLLKEDLLVELFDCDADGNQMEGLWVQKLDEQGQINDLTVYLRPYPAVTVLRNMTKDLAKKQGVLVSEDYWELPVPVS